MQKRQHAIHDRALPASVLSDPRFAGKIKTAARGTVVFPYYNASGWCISTSNQTGMAAG